MKPLAILVDADDNEIGSKDRHELTPDDNIRVTLLWIENSAGQVLLQQRAHAKRSHPGIWGPTGGTVEVGETPDNNVYKEAEEEIGLVDTEITFFTKKYVHPPDRYGAWLYIYRTVCDWPVERFMLQKEEVEQVQWRDKTDILQAYAKDPDQFMPSAIYWTDLFLQPA